MINKDYLYNREYYKNQGEDSMNYTCNLENQSLQTDWRQHRNPSENADLYEEWVRATQNQHSIKKKILELRSMYYIHRSKMFSGEYYLNAYPEVAKALKQTKGWKLRQSDNHLIQTIGKLLSTPIKHYVKYGVYEGKNPNLSFDTRCYINNYEDLRVGKYVNAFEHYCRIGIMEGRICGTNRLFDSSLKMLRGNKKTGGTVSVIMPYNGDFNELKNRLRAVSEQTVRPIECIFIDCPETLADMLDEKNTVPFRFIRKTETQQNIYKLIVKYANGDYIWVLEENFIPAHNFIEEMLKAIQYEMVVLADCYSDQIRQNVSYYFDKDRTCETIGILEKEYTNLEPVYIPSKTLFKNPKNDDTLSSQSWDITSRYGFARFVLNYLRKGLFAHQNTILVHSVTMKQQVVHNVMETEECYRYLKDLYQIYHVDPKFIQRQYENLRMNYLAQEKSDISYCINHFTIEGIFQQDYKPNVLISIYSFTHGGGEIMPIRLANELHIKGINVYVHVLNNTVIEDKVRNMLEPGIPVFYTGNINTVATIMKSYGIEVVNTHHQALQSFFGVEREFFEKVGISFYHVGTTHGLYDQFKESILLHVFDKLKDGVDHWTYVADKNIIPFQLVGKYKEEKFTKIPNGMKQPVLGKVKRKDLSIPEDAFVCAIASRAIKEKGWYDSITCVEKVRKQTKREVHLILIGEGPIYERLRKCDLPKYIHLLGLRDNPCDYYNISDVEILLSTYKSESAPLSIIEAMMVGKPVIASDLGDIRKMLTIKDSMAGDVVALEDGSIPQDRIVQILLRMITNSNYYQKCCTTAIRKSREYDLSNITDQYIEVFRKSIDISNFNTIQESINKVHKSQELILESYGINKQMKVSVIVPNYNHSEFLRQRLDCIYHQTYQNIEVILLDDCSSDNSRDILREYAEKYSKNTRLVLNEVNSGGVFHQWSKGIHLATGDICWIAESDDYCDYDLIEKLITAFQDPMVKISYGNYQFVNQDGKQKEYTFSQHMSGVSKTKWKQNYVNDSSSEVKEAFAYMNSIPNVSGVLFRKPKLEELFQSKRWLSMRICGDWVFYLYLIYGGNVSYCVDTTSYFRFHSNNSSAATYSRPEYYTEHAYVAEVLRELYGVDLVTLKKMCDKVHEFYNEHVTSKSISFDQLFNLSKIMKIPMREFMGKEESRNRAISERKYRETLILNPIKADGTNLDVNIEDKLLYYGYNTGNMLFVEAMKKQLVSKDVIYYKQLTGNELDDVTVVMPSSNFLIRGYLPIIEVLQKFMNNYKGPFILAGLGAQSISIDDTPKRLVAEMGQEKVRFFKSLSERAVSIGVRGEFTAACLEEMGIYNYRIIGCPSAYLSMDGEFKMEKQPSSKRCVFTVTMNNAMESKTLILV